MPLPFFTCEVGSSTEKRKRKKAQRACGKYLWGKTRAKKREKANRSSQKAIIQEVYGENVLRSRKLSVKQYYRR